MTRRQFAKTVAAAAIALPGPAPTRPKLCFFSKPLPKMDPRRLARTLKPLGYEGVDLTARKDGHVAPERATDDLPKAVEAIRSEGLEVPMITTNLLSATEPDAKPILTAAGKLGIPFFKPGYYKYDFVDVRRELEKAAGDFRGLARLAHTVNVQTGYHNHGGYIGGPVWDIAEMLEGLDPAWAGYYFDAAHAVAEGGEAGWRVALNRAAPRLKMVAVKDFYWEKSARGWRPKFCPLGEGMVDWKYFFTALKKAGFQGPLSIHIEYDPGDEAAVLEAARHDLEYVKAHL